MKFLIDDNSTRRSIILLLKKHSGMTIEDISRNINITPMGIRQHLLALEKRGFVTYSAKKHGIGRPGFIYMLTEHAEELFPKAYDIFALELLRDIERNDGKEKVDRLFRLRRDKVYRKRKEALNGKNNIDDILGGLKNILESEGYVVDLTRNNGSYHLVQYNCPIKKIAVEFKDACRHELLMYQDIVGREIVKDQSLSDGNTSCHYIIPRV